MLNLSLFGAPRLARDGVAIEFDTRKALALLAYLAVVRQSHSRDALATLLYPDFDQTRARAALRRTLSALNTALGEGQLEIDRESIGLGPNAELGVDVEQFRRAVNECKKHGHSATEVCAGCIGPLTRAADLYRDDFLAGFTLRDSPNFDDWQFFESEDLRREFAGVLEKLVRHHSAQQSYAQAIAYARRWLALDPLHEPAHRHLMQLYAWSGQRAAALRQYQECVRALKQDLDVQPLGETTRLYETIRENKLTPPEGTRSAQKAEISEQALPSAYRLAPSERYPLVGRSAEWNVMTQAYASIGSDGHFIVLEGEAGIGKTRLAEEFLSYAREHGAVTVSARAYEGETNLAYGIFAEALAGIVDRADLGRKTPTSCLVEVARLVPEIGTAQSTLPLESPGAQARFFECISRTLYEVTRRQVPGIIFFDDLQWADVASIDLVIYIVQRLRGQPLCVLAAWRNEQTSVIQPLHHFAAQSQRAGTGTVLTLPRLSQSAVMQLVESVTHEGATLTKGIGERLYQETEGLPFFVVEYLSAVDKGTTVADVADWALPGGVRDLLHARLAAVSEIGGQLLGAAAVIGRSFDFDTLRDASGRSEEETVTALEDLIARGLVKEMANSSGRGLAYDFSHEKLRTLAYEETSQARRRLLHRRVAESIAARARWQHQSGALASQVAYHYERSGQDAEAAEYFKLAGEHARALYANAEALAHFRSALALNHPDATVLHEAIGDLLTLKGDYTAALGSYENAAKARDPKDAASLERKRGALHHRRGEWEMAEAHFQAALDALRDHSDGERARISAEWSLTAHQQGHADQAEQLARRALDLAQAVNDTPALAQAHNLLGILASSRGDVERAREHLEQSVTLAEQLDDPGIRVAALNNLALTCRAKGETTRAIELTKTALALCLSQGDRHREAALHNNLADLLHEAGQTEAAMAHLKQAVAIFAEIGEEAGTRQLEIWKLVEW